MGDIGGFIDKSKELKLTDKNELFEKMKRGQVTLRDLYEQWEDNIQMGLEVLTMYPGLNQNSMTKDVEQKMRLLPESTCPFWTPWTIKVAQDLILQQLF